MPGKASRQHLQERPAHGRLRRNLGLRLGLWDYASLASAVCSIAVTDSCTPSTTS